MDQLGEFYRVISIGKWILWDFVIYYSFSTVALKEGNMTFGERAGSLKLKTTQESNLENEVYMHNKTHGFFVTY